MICRFLRPCTLLSATIAFGLLQTCRAQDSGNNSWNSDTHQQDSSGAINPIHTNQSHSEDGGRVIDKQSVETMGPDGRYIPYQETEKETVKIDANTVRNVERIYGRDADGQRILIQENREESRSLPAGEQKIVRTISNPDGDGRLQVMRQELQDSKHTSPDTVETKTTVLTPSINGGLAASVQIDESQKNSGRGAVESRKSTSLSDGTGRWQLSEVREGTTSNNGGETRKEERVLRPDSNGKLETVERTVSQQTDNGSGQKLETVEHYSNNVPGTATDGGLQLVRRDTNVYRKTTAGEQNVRQIERPTPGESTSNLRLTEEAIDIVRPGSNGSADQKSTILTQDANGHLGQVWVDMGRTSNPSAIQPTPNQPPTVQVNTNPPAKPQ
jgi:hypothetical protein